MLREVHGQEVRPASPCCTFPKSIGTCMFNFKGTEPDYGFHGGLNGICAAAWHAFRSTHIALASYIVLKQLLLTPPGANWESPCISLMLDSGL